jgi:flagellin-like hook-associated protein FlgL
MAGIVPIPNTRVSNLFTRQRLMAQLQADQLDIFRLQTQVSTGQRITLPSEDAPAARRAITLQRLLERKEQLRSNVQTGKSFLQATDVALNNVSTLLGEIRGTALGAASTTATETERKSAIEEINRAIEQLAATANTQFRGRYLFAGSQTNVEPYAVSGDYVRYAGDGQTISAFSDIGVLFGTNAAGMSVFGGVSSEVLGGTDLNPEVTVDTPLSSLRNGQGISPNGALRISDGTTASIVDITSAATIGDVLRKIEANPPAGRSITASLTGNGIALQLDSAGGGALTVTEVASGKAASELGILETVGAPPAGLVGDDLEPVLLNTTPLADLLGSKARTRLVGPGNNNDLLIEATANGAQFNGVAVQLVDDNLLHASPGLARGNEYAQYQATAQAARASLKLTGAANDLALAATTPGTAYNNVDVVIVGASGHGPPTAAYDGVAKRLTITVDDAAATAVEDIRLAINAEGTFQAAHDESAEGAAYNPASVLALGDIGVVRGDTGNSGGAAGTLYVYVQDGQSTAGDIAAAINAEGTFHASIDTFDMTSTVAAGTGVVPINTTAITAGGSGATLDLASGIQVTNGGTTHAIAFDGAETVEDLLNILNGSPAGLHAEINADGTGVNLRSRLSGADFQIAENGGQTATQLGIRSLTGDTRLEDLNYGVGVPTKRDSLLEIPDPPPAFVLDFTITADDGVGTVDLTFDVSGANSVQDVIDMINNHALNNVGGVDVLARLATTGNGIELVDRNGRPLSITAAEGSQAAEYLGLIPAGSATVTSAGGVITGVDRNYRETPSVFTTLVRLKKAFEANDINAMERAIASIDVDLDRVVFARSEVGAREQALDITQQNLEDEDVQLRTALADEIEVDMIEAITNLTARQASMEASLRAAANILQLSLLNFL